MNESREAPSSKNRTDNKLSSSVDTHANYTYNLT
jgi:hypothetical protein